MTWAEFMNTAMRLLQGRTEGDWRSAISRAYYAVFHFFREGFLAHGLDLGRGGQCHFNLYVGLYNCGDAVASMIGNRVDSLRKHRVQADYDFSIAVTSTTASDCLSDAQAVIAEFQILLQSTPPAQIVAGARKHLQAIGKLGKTP